jgi:hypothetical protein
MIVDPRGALRTVISKLAPLVCYRHCHASFLLDCRYDKTLYLYRRGSACCAGSLIHSYPRPRAMAATFIR